MTAPLRPKPALRAPLHAIDSLGSPARTAADAAPAVRRVAVALSHLGRGGLPWFALAPIVGSGSRRRSRFGGTAHSAAAIGSALLLSTALSRAIARPRPCDQGIRSLIPCPEGDSLPSDQAAAAFAAAEILGWFQPRLHTPLRATAACVAIARVAAGVHYPTDVIAGGALGAAIGLVTRAHACGWNIQAADTR